MSEFYFGVKWPEKVGYVVKLTNQLTNQHYQVVLIARIPLSLLVNIHSSRPSLIAGLLNYIQNLH